MKVPQVYFANSCKSDEPAGCFSGIKLTGFGEQR